MKGFIIHQRKFKETSLFLELFTRCRGRLSVLAKGANRPKSSLGFDLQPLRLLNFSLHERTTTPILKSVDLIENYHITMGSKMLSPNVNGWKLHSFSDGGSLRFCQQLGHRDCRNN